MHLTVEGLSPHDCWKDIVRIKEQYRNDWRGKPIKRGKICRITIGGKSAWVVVHGRNTDEPVIQMDLNLRQKLEIRKGRTYDFDIRQIRWPRSLWFPWYASDPGYRLPAQLALITSFVGTILGIAGVLLGIAALGGH